MMDALNYEPSRRLLTREFSSRRDPTVKKILSLVPLMLSASAPLLAQPADQPPTKKAAPKPKAEKQVVRAGGTAFLRVLHAMPGGPSVDVYDGSVKVASSLGFKSISDYMEVKSGKSAFKVVGAGKTDPTVVTDSATLTKGKYYTLAISGKQTASLMNINESSGTEMPDKARVRVVHLAPGAPAVLVTAPSEKAKSGYAKFISKPLEYSKSASKTAKPMAVKLQIRTEDGKIIKETAELTLEAGKRYSAFAVGEVGATGANAIDIIVKPAAK
jgi:hypothetical protein